MNRKTAAQNSLMGTGHGAKLEPPLLPYTQHKSRTGPTKHDKNQTSSIISQVDPVILMVGILSGSMWAMSL